jgi:hypothetical protein
MTGSTRTGPSYPRLLRGLVLAETGSGLVVEGGPRRQLLSGGAGSVSWTDLLPLLDGAHSVADCAAELDVGAAAIGAAVRTLDDGDLLEAGPGPAASADAAASDDAAATFLSRSVTVTRWHDNGQQASRALRDSVVIVAAPPPFAAAMHADAHATGVGTVIMRPSAMAVSAQDIERASAAWPRCVVAAWDGPGEEDALRSLERACAAARVPLLRFACGDGRIEVGPLFFAEYTACYSCFADGYATGLAAGDQPPAGSGESGESATQGMWLAAALVLREVLAVTAQLTAVDSYRRLTVTALDDYDQRRFLVTRRPGCPDCASGLPRPSPSAMTADAYEWLAESAPPELRPARARADGQPAAIPPARYAGLWASPRYALPEAAAALPEAAPRFDAGGLAAVLERVVGGAEADRGDFGSMELLVITGPGWVDGQGEAGAAIPALAAGGIFRYDSQGRELILAQRPGAQLPDVLDAAGLAVAESPLCLLVFISAVWRLMPGHGTLAYRVAHLDAGGATCRLTQSAADYGLRARFASHWPERLAELFELGADMELLVAIAGLYREER